MERETEYCGIEDYGLIGDMHTCALIGKDGSLNFMCWPVFDSPSIFCHLLDKDKGGHFSICPVINVKTISKQRYRPYTNVLETRWIHEHGVVTMLDFFPVSKKKPAPPEVQHLSGWCPCDASKLPQHQSHRPHSGIIRKVECLRGAMDMELEVFPAFNYARDKHTARPLNADSKNRKLQTVLFESVAQKMQLEIFTDSVDGEDPVVTFQLHNNPGLLGPGVAAKFSLEENQTVAFVMHSTETALPEENLLSGYLDGLEKETLDYWTDWTSKCTFRGHYREQVERSLLILKLLTYKPTGAIVAAPTFSLPESIGGPRNWDYRYSWVRDAAFTVYVFLKNGYREEAESYIDFIFSGVFPPVQSQYDDTESFLPIMVTIRGERDIPETELDHLEGYRNSRPVRIGNGAANHKQLDIYGELMDSIYLYNKHANPISYEQWLSVRRMIDYVIRVRNDKDRSIWEVRGDQKNFVYSKIMLWVALDRAVRLAEKRSNLPCPDRIEWMRVRDELYDEIMSKGFNLEKGYFCMSYESQDMLDAAVLIAPLVFFIAPNDPRLISTLKKIMEPSRKGGLSIANMVCRYDHTKVDDGVGGEEGAFIMVTFWLVEAMMRASKCQPRISDDPFLKSLREAATAHFDGVLSFANHLGMFSEEVAVSGEQIGNTPQAFSHLACVSAAMHLGDYE
ncbi:Six-hairpin glycosidase-like protein [Lipomyces tetrasporus]